MKRIISVILAVLLAAACLTGCGKKNENPDIESRTDMPEETPDISGEGEKGEFRVGYAREKITPMDPIPLAGYGNTDRRLSEGFLDHLYVTCVAITGTNDETVLWYTVDLINVRQDRINTEIKEAVNKNTGVPVENMNINCTHTHSSVDTASGTEGKFPAVTAFIKDYQEKAILAAMEAMADRASAEKMEYGVADLTSFNFVKHYFTDLDESVGDNHGSFAKGTINRHTTESNHDMYLLRFKREGKKDIVLSNFRAHATLTGGSEAKDISADYVGYLRKGLEADGNTLFAFFQGEGGNQNPVSRLSTENVHTKDVEVWAADACKIISETLDTDMKEIKTGEVHGGTKYVNLEINHSKDSLLGKANVVASYFHNSNDRAGTLQMCAENGFESPYEAEAIISNAGKPKTQEVLLTCAVVGEFCLSAVPFEQFDTNGSFVRDNAPTPYSFILGYSNESWGYLPSQYAYEYGCYEADVTHFLAGSGETVASEELALINEIWAKGER